ncbi:MAG TPA: hypothetical protein DCL61_29470, partial [Cyanobacteria bacterium UBA12227]|nr:hypothetical protein [Cyanobacteria bacterium UBA12227]
FEEFFFTYSSVIERRLFWEFLGECLQILSVKVILSLREDYLHYLLEGNRLESMSVIGHDILGKNVLYGLGNFSPIDARAIIEDLTTRSRFYLEPELIDELVKDLAGLTGEVLPIELQVVGAQLQAEGIKTLVQYRELGTKEELVRRYLAEVVSDCGVENRQAAELVLYLLTDEKGTRPLKTRVELERDLEALVGDLNTEVSKLDFILRIFVESGLVLLLPEKPANRYQLVHDYLSVFIRQQQELGLVAELAAAKEKQRLTEAQLRQVLKEKEEALQKEQEERKRAEIAEIEALNSLSQVLWLSDKQLEALLAVVKAAKKLQHMADLAPSELKRQIRNQFYQTLNQVRERNCLEGHSDTVYSISFSPDGQMIASASGDGTVKLWELDGTLLHTFQANRVGLYSVSFSPDGQTIISAGADGILKLWKLDGTLLHTFEGHGGGTYSVNFSPNGQVIASAGDDGAVKIWKLDGTLLHTFEGHTGQIYTVCFSPDGHTIASANADGIMKLWQFDGQRLKTFQRHLGVVTTVTFSPDGQTVASASPDGTLKLWNIDGMRLQTIEGYREAVKTVSFSPDGQMIASASADGTVKVWGVDGALLQTFWGHSERVYSVSFSPDLQKIASASADGRVKLWHFEGAGVQEFQGRGGMVWSVCFSPDGRMIASANYNNTVKLWRLDGTVVQTLQGHTDRVLSVCFSPN